MPNTVDWVIVEVMCVKQGGYGGRTRYVLKDVIKYVPMYGWQLGYVSKKKVISNPQFPILVLNIICTLHYSPHNVFFHRSMHDHCVVTKTLVVGCYAFTGTCLDLVSLQGCWVGSVEAAVSELTTL